jgi:hypothetical protein
MNAGYPGVTAAGQRDLADYAAVIQGSVRPSVGGSTTSSSSYTRQQHLDSFVNDDALKRSTRKVSTGMC